LTDAERTALRQRKAVPQLDALHEWASALLAQTLASGKLGDALGYLLQQWAKLIRYIEEGRLAIDTNLAENAIRPFALGRRNWLFSDTVNGAKASASLYSLVQTARANEFEPYAYLRRLFAELPAAHNVADFEALLPGTSRVSFNRHAEVRPPIVEEAPMPDLLLRVADAQDVPLLLSLIRELAVAEEFPFPVTVTEEDLRDSLFGANPAAEAVLGFAGDRAAGFTVFYETFATKTGKRGMYLDDLFVRPEFQGMRLVVRF
jgi:hypothetical protein